MTRPVGLTPTGFENASRSPWGLGHAFTMTHVLVTWSHARGGALLLVLFLLSTGFTGLNGDIGGGGCAPRPAVLTEARVVTPDVRRGTTVLEVEVVYQDDDDLAEALLIDALHTESGAIATFTASIPEDVRGENPRRGRVPVYASFPEAGLYELWLGLALSSGQPSNDRRGYLEVLE